MTNKSRWGAMEPEVGPANEQGGPGSRLDVLTIDEQVRPIASVIAALGAVPVELGRLIEGRSREDLIQPAQDGGWGLVEIISHLRDWEVIHVERLEQVLAEDPATVQEHDDSLWAIEHGYRDLDPRETFTEFAHLREQLVERLASLAPSEWQRIVILPKRGRVTLHWLMSSLYDHDTKHLVQAREVLA
ncbi:MAG TPA: DinB family protein [Thermomicrobiales bacterium]|nr:DinB family protein [Thermomicrobiales bacterium]